MAGTTSIEWTDHSENPIRARDLVTGATGHFCEKISPGCAKCYASRMQRRFGMHEFKPSNRGKVKLYLDETVLDRIEKRKKPTKYFLGNMSDLFLEGVQDDWLDRIFATMFRCRQHTFQILTKRPDRALRYTRERVLSKEERDFKRFPNRDGRFPQNVWFGISVEWGDYRPRDEGLGPRARGEEFPLGKMPRGAVRIDETGRDVTELPGLWDDSDAWMIPGKKSENGRMLDGREWSEFPAKAVI